MKQRTIYKMSEENMSTNDMKEVVSSKVKCKSVVFDSSENACLCIKYNDEGDCPCEVPGPVESDVFDEEQKDIEEDIFKKDIPDRFVSVIEKRRMDRKIEEEREIDWKLSEKVEDEHVASKVESLISKLKNRFSEEKEARKRALKSNRSYFEFCNSVDSFLRYVEKPKAEVKYSKRDNDLQGEGQYSFGVRPVCVKGNRKVAEINSPKIVNDTNNVIAKETVIEDVKNDTNSLESEQRRSDLVRNVKDSQNAAPIGQAHSPHELCSLQVSIKSVSSDDVECQAIFLDGNTLQQESDDSCRLFPIANYAFSYNEYKPFRSAKSTPVLPFLCDRVLRGMPMFCTERYRLIMSSFGKDLDAISHTDTVIIPRRGAISLRLTQSSVFNVVQSNFFNKMTNYAGKFPMNIAADDNGLPVFCVMSFNDGFGTISPLSVAYLRTKQRYVMNTTSNKIPSRKNKNLPGYKEISRRFLPLENYKTKYQETRIAPSHNDERVTKFVTTIADDKKLSTDDGQETEHTKIIDEYEDTGPFGIMSVYCNSELHARYDKVPTEDKD